MNKEELIKKLQDELPELNWQTDLRYADLETNFACAPILAGEVYSEGEGLEISNHVMERILSYIEMYNLDTTGEFHEVFDPENCLTPIEKISEYVLDLIIKGLKYWIKYIDKLRKSDVEKDQLIFIHPDWDIDTYFKKDFKIIVGDDDLDWRLGIMSTTDWNFGNDDLCDELQENSCDCFGIGQPEEDDLDKLLDDWGLTEAYKELKEKYPDVISITDIYETDFD